MTLVHSASGSVPSAQEEKPAAHTPGPWSVCQHLKSVADDRACHCGYRGVIWGPEHDYAMAVCQPGHDPAPRGEEGLEPARYPRAVEIANAHLISAAPDLLAALIAARDFGLDDFTPGEQAIYRQMDEAIAKATGAAS